MTSEAIASIITGLFVLASGTLGYYLSVHQQKILLAENRNEAIKARKVKAAEKTIDAISELLEIISHLSNINQDVKRATNNQYTFISLIKNPDFMANLKSKEPQLIDKIYSSKLFYP